MMNSFITLIIVGWVIYFLFSKKGSIGCCGGHGGHHNPPQANPPVDDELSNNRKESTIDLGRDDYEVVAIEKRNKN